MTIDLDELERLAAAARCDFSEETSRFLDAVSPDVVRELIARVREAESGVERLRERLLARATSEEINADRHAQECGESSQSAWRYRYAALVLRAELDAADIAREDWDAVHRVTAILCDRIRDVLDPIDIRDKSHAIEREVTEALSWVCRGPRAT